MINFTFWQHVYILTEGEKIGVGGFRSKTTAIEGVTGYLFRDVCPPYPFSRYHGEGIGFFRRNIGIFIFIVTIIYHRIEKSQSEAYRNKRRCSSLPRHVYFYRCIVLYVFRAASYPSGTVVVFFSHIPNRRTRSEI